MTAKRKLPIGVQTFRKIRQDNCYYVDKSAFILDLIDGGSYYFLSRPRSFGSRDLFAGLYAESHWDWSVSYPVPAFSFSGGAGNGGRFAPQSGAAVGSVCKRVADSI